MAQALELLGVDLGAESGRVMLGAFEGGRLSLSEAHRFPNEPVRLGETLAWDLPRLLLEVERGIAAGARKAQGPIAGIGVDSWGVDFGLLARSGDLLGLPVHYRDSRTRGIIPELLEKIPREELFARTGTQFLELNTLCQLVALQKRSPEVLEAADKLLLMADLLHYLLSGRIACEETLASTSQLWSPTKRKWSVAVTEAFGIDARILPEVVPPGSLLGELRASLVESCGLRGRPRIIAPGCHDTASAIAAVPADGSDRWAYLSSGTWSLVGLELPGPNLSPEALSANFTNETGAGGRTRFLKNINGLFLVQECRRAWGLQGSERSYAELASQAEAAGPARALILPDAPELFAPADMPAAIRDLCSASGQPAPAAEGEVIRCVLESLALAYAETLSAACAITGRAVEALHIVGGGSRNETLNQLAADAAGVPVLAGPVEATAMGNLLLQAQALGEVGSMADLRRIVRASTALREFRPRDPQAWAEKRARFSALRQRGRP